MVLPRQKIRTYRIEASSVEQLQAKVPRISLLPGSTGRLEITATRVLGVCLVPLGGLINLPFVGNIWANSLTPKGATLTNRGGIGVCDAFIEWAIPEVQTLAFRQATMGIGPVALLAVVAGIAIALSLLAWSISKLVLSVVAFLESAPPELVKGLGVLAVAGAALLVLGTTRKRKTR